MEYPSVIQLETVGACNAACAFCPHGSLGKGQQQAKMDEWLFRKLIGELAEWPTAPRICPFLTNEPFADARMPEWCEYINQRLPTAPLTFFTNGSLFTRRLLGQLAEVRNVAGVFLSLHHSNREDYESEVGLKWDDTLASIHRFLKWNRDEEWAGEVRLLRVQDGNHEKDAAFQAFCAAEFPGVPVTLSQRWNWKGDIASPYSPDVLDIICPRHNSMCVLADGRVALCCMDQAGQYSLGNANTESLFAIYNGEKALAYRKRTKRQSVPCLSCNMVG